jgi:HD-GYP domain-containing protein (c-di-GMP phosphodiesterase class II)
LLEWGRDLLGRLRDLGGELDSVQGTNPLEEDPLAALYREAAAMAETSLRLIQAFPDAPSAQLRLCAGLEASFGLLEDRLERLTVVVRRRREEAERIETLANLLTDLASGKAMELQPFLNLGEQILQDALQAAPLRFLHASTEQPARFVACHSLTVAQVIARLVRHDPDLRGRQIEPVLAALLHDAGMLQVPAEVLRKPGPLDDAERRLMEGHCRAGAELMTRLLPDGVWLVQAAAAHHERLDGTGYPDGLHGARLGSVTRLLTVCDIYAALCAPRPYRPGRDPRTALADTLLLAEQGALDRVQAERLLLLSFYPIGSVVELADGALAVVVAAHPLHNNLQTPARPVVTLLTDSQGQVLPLPSPLDLAQCESRSILRTLSPAERLARLGRDYPEWV